MALQFNEYFARTKLIPTLKVFLTRMSQPADADKKGTYLSKLLIPEKLDANDKKLFNSEYFTGIQPADRAFKDESEAPYRSFLLEEMGTYLAQQRTLLGPEGMRKSLLPGEKQDYSTSSDLSRHLNEMAYRLIQKFEQNIIKEREGEMSEEEKNKLQSGELRLVAINGESKVISKVDLESLPAETVIVPLVQPDLHSRLMDIQSGSQQPVITETVVTVTTTDMSESLHESLAESAKEMMEIAGLEVISMEMSEDGNTLKGIVRDVNGDLLNVEIDGQLSVSDSRKIKFTFQDAVIDKSDGKKYGGKSFYLSQNDLQPRFMPNGQRQPADQVYQNLPASAVFKGYELPPESSIPIEPLRTRSDIPAVKPQLPSGSAPINEPIIAAPIPGSKKQILSSLPAGPIREAPSSIIAQREGGRDEINRRNKSGLRVTGRGKKSKTAASGTGNRAEQLQQAEQQPEQQPQQPQQPPQAPQRVNGGGQQQQLMQQRQQRQKKEKRNRLLLALGATGAVTAGPVITLLTSLGVNTINQADKAEKGLTFIIQCIGTNCLS